MAEVATPYGWASLGRRRHGLPPLVAISSVAVAAVLIFALVGDVGLFGDPHAQALTIGARPPTGGYPLGTDQLGRDVLARLVAGTRPAVVGPIVIATVTALLGATLGMLAGLRGGLVDAAISRYVDLVISLPGLLLVIVFVGTIGGGYLSTIAIFVVLLLPGAIRLCRSATLSRVRLPFLDAATTMGLSTWRILRHYLFPNILPTVLATGLLDFVGALVGFSSLSYLGLGVSVGTPDWGRMLAEGRPLILRNPWAAVAPASAIVVTAAAVTLLADWLHERLAVR